jgi:NAD(P)-dependent dehydrogenase (short-subunit alcohol dehydrogenase family)
MTGLLIIGAGPGIATSIARRFGREGAPVSLVSRSEKTLEALQTTLRDDEIIDVFTHAADAADAGQLADAIDTVVARRGVPEVVVYNAGWIRFDEPGELDRQGHLDAYAVNVLGALDTAVRLAPAMAARATASNGKAGTILFTGGMPEPLPALVSLSVGKAALRALTHLLAEQYGPRGVHVATVTVGGAVAPGTDFDPDLIAAHYWRLHRQPTDPWETEYLFAGEPIVSKN